jgi:hypothetical protein
MRGREFDWKKLTEIEKGYLFGLFEGDGYKFYDKKSRHYHVEFYFNSVKDIKIIIRLIGLLKKIGFSPNSYKDKRFNCLRIRLYSKSLYHLLIKSIELVNKSGDFSLGYISGLIDSEGHVNKSKNYILVINTNKKVLEQSKKFLKDFGIKSSISLRKKYRKDKKNSYRMYISVNFKSLNHVSIKAGNL